MTRLIGKFFRALLVVYVFVLAYQWWRPMPEQLVYKSPVYLVPEQSVHFLSDVTYLDKSGVRKTDQHIWDQIFSTIDRAQYSVVLDMFLFNDFQGETPETTRALSSELTNALLAKKDSLKHIAIAFITDPINTVYGGVRSGMLDRLNEKGVLVITTDLGPLLDSNLFWSAAWRPFFSWMGNSTTGGWLAHPFQYGGNKVTLRSWLALLNFKANHRKLVIADEPEIKTGKVVGQKMVTIITSSNPHDGSSAHGNVALKLDDQVWQDALAGERQVAVLSGSGLPSFNIGTVNDEIGPLRVTMLREEAIRTKAVELLDSLQKGDAVDIAMFYLSDRDIISALKAASARGVYVRLILDPNKDAFGFTKNGIPNRPVAKELVNANGSDIQVRWCDTHGEQCHAKLMVGKTATSTFMLLGSANFTRRNIGGYNLEEDVFVLGDAAFPAWNDAESYMNRLWNNTDGQFTADYDVYKDDTWWKASIYRVMELTGMSSF